MRPRQLGDARAACFALISQRRGLGHRCDVPWLPLVSCVARSEQKAGVAPFRNCRGHCVPLWAVFPPLQVVLSSACSVTSLSRCPSRYLPGHPHLHEDALADYLFGKGSSSARRTGHTEIQDTPSAKPPSGAQGGITLPGWYRCRRVLHTPCAPRVFLSRVQVCRRCGACALPGAPVAGAEVDLLDVSGVRKVRAVVVRRLLCACARLCPAHLWRRCAVACAKLHLARIELATFSVLG